MPAHTAIGMCSPPTATTIQMKWLEYGPNYDLLDMRRHRTIHWTAIAIVELGNGDIANGFPCWRFSFTVIA